MTINETAAVIDILRIAYPNSYLRLSDEDKYLTAQLWASAFEGDDVGVVLGAVRNIVATDTSGFPPPIGKVREAIESRPKRRVNAIHRIKWLNEGLSLAEIADRVAQPDGQKMLTGARQ